MEAFLFLKLTISEESLIGTTTRVWQRAMRGRYQQEGGSNVLLRRVLGLLLRLELGA